MTWLAKVEQLRPGDACEFRYPARPGWRLATVITNGGGGFWKILDEETQKTVDGLYIEYIRCVGQTEAWGR
jgi:hypothetical protein